MMATRSEYGTLQQSKGAVDSPPTAIEDLTRGVIAIHERASLLVRESREIADRVFGPYPEGEDAKTAESQFGGNIGSLAWHITSLGETVDAALREVSRLRKL